MLAGEPERRMRAARADAIPIDATTWAGIADVATRLGVPRTLIDEAVA